MAATAEVVSKAAARRRAPASVGSPDSLPHLSSGSHLPKQPHTAAAASARDCRALRRQTYVADAGARRAVVAAAAMNPGAITLSGGTPRALGSAGPRAPRATPRTHAASSHMPPRRTSGCAPRASSSWHTASRLKSRAKRSGVLPSCRGARPPKRDETDTSSGRIAAVGVSRCRALARHRALRENKEGREAWHVGRPPARRAGRHDGVRGRARTLFRTLTSAPPSSSARAASSLPWKAAWCSGVLRAGRPMRSRGAHPESGSARGGVPRGAGGEQAPAK